MVPASVYCPVLRPDSLILVSRPLRSAHPSGSFIDPITGLSYSTWRLGEDACHARYTIDWL